jgi:phage terminase large subunit-like protein
VTDRLAPSLGRDVIDWIETFLVHGPGDVQGEPIDLDDELAAFIWRAYELRPDGSRQFRRAFLSRAKGRAKSELAAMLACAELLGPVRCDGFDAAGDPVGVPVRAPEVLCIATEEDQAGFVYQGARYMLERGEAGNVYPLDTGLTRTYLPAGGSMEPVTAKANSKDGGKSTFVVADETHLWTSRELKALHATVRRNIVKRKRADGWLLETSTAYCPGENSVAEGSIEHARLVMSGEISDPTLLVDHREADPRHDLSTPEGLRAAILDAYGAAAPWTNVDGIIAEFSDPQNDPADNRRYWLNQVVRARDQWMDAELWKACAVDDVEVARRERICVGFDGSQFDDATALVGCRLDDGHLFLIDIWEKPDGPAGDGWQVDRLAVDGAVALTFERFDVVRMYADPPYWQDYVAAWHAAWSTVHEWWTNRDRAVAAAVERVETAVRGGTLTHDGDARLTRHVLNCRLRDVPTGGGERKHVLRKDRPHSPHKIDAAVAMVLAYEARADAVAAGALTARRSRVPVSL